MSNRYFLISKGGANEGKRIPLQAPKISVGRKPGNTLVLDSNKVSGQHAEIALAGESFVLRDLGSTNGTFVNGIKLDGEAILEHEDKLRFGESEFQFWDSQFTDQAKPAAVSQAEISPSAKAKRSLLLPALVVLLVAALGMYLAVGLFDSKKEVQSPLLAEGDEKPVKIQEAAKFSEYSVGEYLWRLSSLTGSLRKIDSDLLQNLRVSGAEGKIEFEAEQKPNGLRLVYRITAVGEARPQLQFEIPSSFFAEQSILLLHSHGNGRFSVDFPDTAVSSLVLGEERNQLRIRLNKEMPVRGKTTTNGFLVEIPFEKEIELFFQVRFEEEKRRANDLLIEAQRKEESGALGEALAAYTGILNELPFERRIAEKASARRDILLRDGLEQIAQVETLKDRAQFFGLADSFREAKRAASALNRKYATSEIGERAKSLHEEISRSLATLEHRQGDEEARRLQSIARGVEASGQKRLATEIRQYVEEKRSGSNSSGGGPQR